MASSASEKTEKATAKKRSDTRREGNVLKSTEVNTAFCSAVIFALMLFILPTYIADMMEVFRSHFGTGGLMLSVEKLTPLVLGQVFRDIVIRLIQIILPILATAMITGILINLLQVGLLFTTKPIRPKFSKLSPLQGVKRLFSLNSVTELLKSTLKFTVLAYIVYSDYKDLVFSLPMMMGVNLYDALLESLSIAFRIALKCVLAMTAIAILDYFYKRWKHEKDLMMTKQEVKDENKNVEGNPEIKGRIRSKMRQMSAMRMLSSVPTADVVITNPTHFAVALRYVEGVDEAPVVVAKGQDYMALKIREKARENFVQIVEDKPLARALYDICEVGNIIPEEFYIAVAEILKNIPSFMRSVAARKSQMGGNR